MVKMTFEGSAKEVSLKVRAMLHYSEAQEHVITFGEAGALIVLDYRAAGEAIEDDGVRAADELTRG